MLISRFARCFDKRRMVTSVERLSVRARGAARDFRPVKDDILKRIVQFLNNEKDVATFGLVGKRVKRQMEHKREICESRGETVRKGKGWVRDWSFSLLLNGLKPQISGAAGQIFPNMDKSKNWFGFGIRTL